MNTPQPPLPESSSQSGSVDPRLQPTPDYGTLGPGSDVASEGLSPTQPSPGRGTGLPRIAPFAAIFAGVLMAIIVGNVAAYTRYLKAIPKKSTAAFPVAKGSRPSAYANEQKQAEAMLERAVAHSD